MNIVMIGNNDPAGMMIAFTNAINRYTEHTARVVALEIRYVCNFEHDLTLPFMTPEQMEEIPEVIKAADIIHFHMAMDENDVIGPYKISDCMRVGQKILQHHHGEPPFRTNPETFHEKYKRLKRKAIVATPDLLKLLPEATWQPNIVPLYESALLPRFEHLRTNEKIVVAHSPTRKDLKNTDEFLRVTERLQKKYPALTLDMIETVPWREVLMRKRNASIVFDHMQGYFGISSLEALALGLPVIAGIDDWNAEHIKNFTGKEKLPWVIARTEKELETKLSELIESGDLRYEIGHYSRTFMEESWSEEHALPILLKTYEAL